MLVFFDDIPIYSKDEKEHGGHLKQVFEVLQHNIIVNKKKCDFGVARVEYLGHLVLAARV